MTISTTLQVSSLHVFRSPGSKTNQDLLIKEHKTTFERESFVCWVFIPEVVISSLNCEYIDYYKF